MVGARAAPSAWRRGGAAGVSDRRTRTAFQAALPSTCVAWRGSPSSPPASQRAMYSSVGPIVTGVNSSRGRRVTSPRSMKGRSQAATSPWKALLAASSSGCALARELRLPVLRQVAGPVGMTHHPLDVVSDHGPDAALGRVVTAELAQQALLVVAQPFEEEGGRELILAFEVVIHAAGRDRGFGADVADLGFGQAGPVEAAQRGVEDLAAADFRGGGTRGGRGRS